MGVHVQAHQPPIRIGRVACRAAAVKLRLAYVRARRSPNAPGMSHPSAGDRHLPWLPIPLARDLARALVLAAAIVRGIVCRGPRGGPAPLGSFNGWFLSGERLAAFADQLSAVKTDQQQRRRDVEPAPQN